MQHLQTPSYVATQLQQLGKLRRFIQLGILRTSLTYTSSEILAAIKIFRSERVLGDGGFGGVYKGWIHDKSTSKGGSQSTAAIEKWNSESLEGIEQCMVTAGIMERCLLSLSICERAALRITSLEVRVLLPLTVFANSFASSKVSWCHGAFLSLGGSSIQPLQWYVRLKILIGAGRALAFLHALKKPVIFRDFKASSVLLDGSYNAKLSFFELAKMGPLDSQSHVSTRVVGTYGYAAPQYVATGHLYAKSDVCGFGVLLAEVIARLRAMDINRWQGQHSLADWIKPHLSTKE